MQRFVLVGIALIFSVLVACRKPPLEDCRKACWNYMKVMYWARVDKEVESLAPEEAAKLRSIREIEFQEIEQKEEDQGLMNCVAQCRNEGTGDAVRCMLEAKTEARMQVCLDK